MNEIELADCLVQKLPDHSVTLADGFEEAFIGVGWQFSKPLACYDRAKCIEILENRDQMAHDEAEEFFKTNVAGVYVGEDTPVFIDRI